MQLSLIQILTPCLSPAATRLHLQTVNLSEQLYYLFFSFFLYFSPFSNQLLQHAISGWASQTSDFNSICVVCHWSGGRWIFHLILWSSLHPQSKSCDGPDWSPARWLLPGHYRFTKLSGIKERERGGQREGGKGGGERGALKEWKSNSWIFSLFVSC